MAKLENKTELLKEATFAEKRNDYLRAIDIYDQILAKEPEDRRVKFKLFNATICLPNLEIADRLFEEIIFEDSLTLNERLLIAKYYIDLIKTYSLGEELLNDIMLTNPDNKKANELLAKIYIATGRSELAKDKYKYLNNYFDKNYIYDLIDLNLKDQNYIEAERLCNEIVKTSEDKLFIFCILKYLYEVQNKKQELKIIEQKISKIIYQSEDRIATIKTALRYNEILNINKSIQDVKNIKYKLYLVRRGRFKNKKVSKNISSKIIPKLSKNLILQYCGFYVYCVPYPNSGTITNQNGKKMTTNFVTVISLKERKNIIDVYPTLEVKRSLK